MHPSPNPLDREVSVHAPLGSARQHPATVRARETAVSLDFTPKFLPARIATLAVVFALSLQAQPNATVEEEVVTLSPFTVSNNADTTYGARQATTGSLVALDIAKSPFTIMAIDGRMIEELQLITYDDVARFTTVNSTAGQNETANARGFPLQALRNGYAPGGRVYITAAYERVEILKGPNSVLYGLSNPGGGINYISKRPTFKNATKITVTTGSDSLIQGMLDTTAPIEIGGKKLLAYRLVVGASDKDGSFPDQFANYDVIAPSLTARPLPGLELTAEYEKLHRDRTTLNPAPLVAGTFDLTNLGRGRNINFAGADSVERNTQDAYNLSGTYSFQDWLTVRAQYNVSKRIYPGFATWNQDNATQRPQFNDNSNSVRGYNSDLLLRYGFKNKFTGSLLLGSEFNTNYFLTPQYRFTNNNVATSALFPGGIANATRAQLRFRNTADAANGYPIATLADIKQPAYFRGNGGDVTSEFTNHRAVNTIKFFDERLMVLSGYSWAEVTNIGAAPTRTVQSQKANPYQLAAMLDVLQNRGSVDYVRVYGQKATSFRNQFARDAYFNPVPPNRGKITEFGVKFGLFKDRLTGSFAYFDQQQVNLAQAVPAQAVDNPATPADERQTGISVASGRESSEGVEFRLDYEVTKAWTIALDGCFFHGGVVEDEVAVARKGLPLANAPTRSIAFIQRYSFGERLKGLSIGHSINYKNAYSTANNNVANSLRVVPSATLVDVFARYNTKLWGKPVNLNLRAANIMDENYLLSNGRWGEPVSWTFSLNTTF
ncbi:MAG: TonB-dependent receptor plug domain-containing protein [Opitutaceae bacterium]|nr:TonB-dependent receptor plug domain-containing protein [Opitutaceae bacterium]